MTITACSAAASIAARMGRPAVLLGSPSSEQRRIACVKVESQKPAVTKRGARVYLGHAMLRLPPHLPARAAHDVRIAVVRRAVVALLHDRRPRRRLARRGRSQGNKTRALDLDRRAALETKGKAGRRTMRTQKGSLAIVGRTCAAGTRIAAAIATRGRIIICRRRRRRPRPADGSARALSL